MYKRWYDKYPELKSLLTILESVDKSAVDMIAQDFLQIILEKYGDDFDRIIQHMADIVRYHGFSLVGHGERVCIPAPIPVQHDAGGQKLFQLLAHFRLSDPHGAADKIQILHRRFSIKVASPLGGKPHFS